MAEGNGDNDTMRTCLECGHLFVPELVLELGQPVNLNFCCEKCQGKWDKAVTVLAVEDMVRVQYATVKKVGWHERT